MELLILAAGTGARMKQLSDIPKSLLEIMPGKRLLDLTLDAVYESGCFQKVAIAVGYSEDMVRKAFADRATSFIFNPFYSCQTIGTLWMARSQLTEDFIIMNGDLVCRKEVFTRLTKSKGPGLVIARQDEGYAGLCGVFGRESRLSFLDALNNFVREARGIEKIMPVFLCWLAERTDLVARRVDIPSDQLYEIDTPHDLVDVRRRYPMEAI